MGRSGHAGRRRRSQLPPGPRRPRSGAAAVPAAGFTLVELLVVMVILGVLAAVATPILLAQRRDALTTQSLADLRNSAIAVETWLSEDATRATADLDGLDEDQLAAAGVDVTTTLWTDFVLHAEASSYCLAATHVQLPGDALVYRPGDGALPAADTGACS